MYLFIYLQDNPAVYYLTVILFGLIIGSFLNVLIYRLPRMMMQEWQEECRRFLETASSGEGRKNERFNLVTPGSRCPVCNHRITALENIPVISYLFLCGKCSECKSPISVRYPVIETLSALAALAMAWHFGWSIQALLAIILSWALIVLSAIDLEHQLLPDDITLPFLWLGIFANMTLGQPFTDIQSSIIGAMVGYLSLWSVYMLFKLITGKEGMGYGDFKLLAMLGAWLGWQMLPLIIILSSLVGAVAGILLILFWKHGRSVPIPFGPYLAAAGWIALLYGEIIMQKYYLWTLGTL